MFYKNLLKTKKTSDKQFEFDVFNMQQNTSDDDVLVKDGQATLSYNFICGDGSLKSGYGFQELVMPYSETNLDDEYPFAVRGTQVQRLWKLKWYDAANDENHHYLFFYNDENYVCFDDLFRERFMTFFWPTEFTSLPYITNYRYNNQDSILLSGKDDKLMIICGNGTAKKGEAPEIVSCCNHYGKLFAITASARGALVYTDVDIINWDDALTKQLDFSDGRGDLNKIISFNDYLYLFRDFGITKVSVYSSGADFSISHIYKSSGYIHPNTVVEMGDEVYFLEGEKLKSFDGNNVKDVEVDCLSLLKGQDNRYANAEAFDGKYFLACRGFFEGENVGCESCADGYNNNMLVVYDVAQKHVDVLRGVDIRQLLALTNSLKSKLVACFYNDNKAKIGQLTYNGAVFGEKLTGVWKSGKIDFEMPTKRKRIKSISITSFSDCQITIKSDEEEKSYTVKGNSEKQNLQTNVFGQRFEFEISSCGEDADYISDFVVTVSV
ncbi:MAG: hypothetical protein J6A28_04695 [Clostridia bacterium]|nr:hypothetical protein [Clostridia bacterium]